MKRMYREIKYFIGILRTVNCNPFKAVDIYKEFRYCQNCWKRPDFNNDYEYNHFRRWGTCNEQCYAEMVGENLYEL